MALPAHSKLSASASDRWAACPGSVPLSAGLADTAGAAAFEGSQLHGILEQCLIDGSDAVEGKTYKVDVDRKVTFIEPDEEQTECVQGCLDYVRALPGHVFAEMRVAYGRAIGQPDSEAFGTVDVCVLDGTTLHVLDAKFGHTWVRQEENKQMLLYTIGVVDAMESLGDKIESVTLHILQPRVGGSLTTPGWEVSREELEAWTERFKAAAVKVKKAEDTFAPNSVKWQNEYLTPGEDACRWCRAAAGCPKLRAMAEEAANIVDESTTDIGEFEVQSYLETLPSAEIALHALRLPLLDIFAKAVKALAASRLTSGQELPGLKLVKGREGHRRWVDADATKEWLRDLGATPAAMFTEPTLKSPAQMVQTVATLRNIKEPAAQALIDEKVVRNPAKPALVSSDHPGTPWTGGADLSEFEVI